MITGEISAVSCNSRKMEKKIQRWLINALLLELPWESSDVLINSHRITEWLSLIVGGDKKLVAGSRILESVSRVLARVRRMRRTQLSLAKRHRFDNQRRFPRFAGESHKLFFPKFANYCSAIRAQLRVCARAYVCGVVTILAEAASNRRNWIVAIGSRFTISPSRQGTRFCSSGSTARNLGARKGWIGDRPAATAHINW